jgi:hypothetical protein
VSTANTNIMMAYIAYAEYPKYTCWFQYFFCLQYEFGIFNIIEIAMMIYLGHLLEAAPSLRGKKKIHLNDPSFALQ